MLDFRSVVEFTVSWSWRLGETLRGVRLFAAWLQVGVYIESWPVPLQMYTKRNTDWPHAVGKEESSAGFWQAWLIPPQGDWTLNSRGWRSPFSGYQDKFATTYFRQDNRHSLTAARDSGNGVVVARLWEDNYSLGTGRLLGEICADRGAPLWSPVSLEPIVSL